MNLNADNLTKKIEYLAMRFSENEMLEFEKQELNNEFFLAVVPTGYALPFKKQKLLLCRNGYELLVLNFEVTEVIDVSLLADNVDVLSKFIGTHISTYYATQIARLANQEG